MFYRCQISSLYFLAALFLLFCGSCASPLSRYNEAEIKTRWDQEINAFDQLTNEPENPILFYGSSSIRLWDNIREDLSPLVVTRRGFGGSASQDGAFYAKRIFQSIGNYQALVLFFANDITGNEYDKTPAEIEKLAKYIIKASRKQQPDAPVFLIEITQMPARAQVMEQVDASNAMYKRLAEEKDYIHFIPTRELYVNPDKSIKTDLFREDNIHQNAEGYALWKERIMRELKKVL